MDTKKKLGAFVSGAGKTARGLLDHAVRATDQNDDGKFNMEDVAAIAYSMGSALKQSAQAMKENAGEKARERELRALKPIFSSTLIEPEFTLPKFVQVAPRDKRHAGSDVCKDSIGYDSSTQQLGMITIFEDTADAYGITLYPDENREFYYVDPIDRNRYIALSSYFDYIKECCVNELEEIAQMLGAKYFRVTYREEYLSVDEKKMKGKGKVDKVASVDVDNRSKHTEYVEQKIEAEDHFPGHAPIRPVLKYMQRYPQIQGLVTARMNPDNPLQKKQYTLKMSYSSAITESVGAKIDAALKEINRSGNAAVSVEMEAQKEGKRTLCYEIEF